MSVILNGDTRVIVQGITGREGRFHTSAMLQYGTKVVAGVTPGKGGQEVEGVPVYDSVAEAVARHGANTSIIFVPPPNAGKAAKDAIEAGIKTLAVITEGIPQKDVVEFVGRARKKGVTAIGPNCPGIINPALRIKVGIMPVHIFRPGQVGIISRSGTLTYEIAWHLTSAGMGQSTCVGIGGDPVVGLDFIEVLEMFRTDADTSSVVLIGEIGGNAEEMAASYFAETKYPKRVVAFIAGRTAPPGKRMGHAGAIIMGGSGSAASKLEALRSANIPVADKPSDIARLLKE